MAFLCLQEHDAWNGADPVHLAALLERERKFLDRHLGRWVPAYAEYAARESREAHFAALARLTADAVALDRRNVDDLLRAATTA
jgi:TorA maturation chaperone TorD